jgi:hypothetical protein
LLTRIHHSHYKHTKKLADELIVSSVNATATLAVSGSTLSIVGEALSTSNELVVVDKSTDCGSGGSGSGSPVPIAGSAASITLVTAAAAGPGAAVIDMAQRFAAASPADPAAGAAPRFAALWPWTAAQATVVIVAPRGFYRVCIRRSGSAASIMTSWSALAPAPFAVVPPDALGAVVMTLGTQLAGARGTHVKVNFVTSVPTEPLYAIRVTLPPQIRASNASTTVTSVALGTDLTIASVSSDGGVVTVLRGGSAPVLGAGAQIDLHIDHVDNGNVVGVTGTLEIAVLNPAGSVADGPGSSGTSILLPSCVISVVASSGPMATTVPPSAATTATTTGGTAGTTVFVGRSVVAPETIAIERGASSPVGRDVAVTVALSHAPPASLAGGLARYTLTIGDRTAGGTVASRPALRLGASIATTTSSPSPSPPPSSSSSSSLSASTHLTFSASNYSTAVTVTIHPVDDDMVSTPGDGVTGTVSTTTTTSSASTSAASGGVGGGGGSVGVGGADVTSSIAVRDVATLSLAAAAGTATAADSVFGSLMCATLPSVTVLDGDLDIVVTVQSKAPYRVDEGQSMGFTLSMTRTIVPGETFVVLPTVLHAPGSSQHFEWSPKGPIVLSASTPFVLVLLRALDIDSIARDNAHVTVAFPLQIADGYVNTQDVFFFFFFFFFFFACLID